MIMNNELLFSGRVFIPRYRQGDIPIAVTVDKMQSLTLDHTVTVATLLTFLLWLC